MVDKVESVSSWPEMIWLDSMDRLLKELLPFAQNRKYSEVGPLYPLLDSTSESISSLRVLIEHFRLRDAYVVARVVYETSLNACFLLTDPVGLGKRASSHAKQKALRTVVRAIQVSGQTIFEFKMQGADELLQRAEHKALLE